MPGSTRILHFTAGHKAAKLLTASDPPDYVAYVVSDMTNPITRRLVREVREK